MIEVYTPQTQPSKPAPFVPTSPALLALVERAVSAYPGEEDRIRRGAEIVEKGGVRAEENGRYEVGLYRYYPALNGQCSCPDVMLGRAPVARCKHKWALCLYRKLHAAPAPTVRTKTFVACLNDTVGIVTLSQDGRASFAPYDGTLPPWALSAYEICYTMVLGMELVASA